MRYYITGHRWG